VTTAAKRKSIAQDELCSRCGGEGFVVVCFDTDCRESGHCYHGEDGEMVCPDCGGYSMRTPAEGNA
jgi:hypothetical protein